ncbi:MAG: DUF4325 domain-containing protein [Methanobrevibacter sp.]|jgi:hypothetical protein|nr:DUF4325 domain-containing protein [Candidatus Methanovirga meridionalis]
MNEEIVEIKVKDKIHKNLGMNSSAKNLFDELNNSPNEEINIDFSDVVIMSRSFAQEYIYQKNKSKKKIEEVNVPKDILPMFKVVQKDFNFNNNK